MKDWRPLSVREGRANNWDGPHEGVPPWMFGPLAAWLHDRYPLYYRGSPRPGAVAEYQRLAMALRISLDDPRDLRTYDAKGHQKRFIDMATHQPELLLDAADHWLSIAEFPPYPTDEREAVVGLQAILRRAGSVYTVMYDKRPYLGRIVGEQQQEAALAVFGRTSRAAEHLSSAWRAAYGRDPDATAAYREAVRAVEAAAIAVVSPKNAHATLGTVLGELRAHPDRVALRIEVSRAESAADVIIAMVATLWVGQQDRHGTPDTVVPIAVSLEQAQDAVRLAVLLVEWFESGAITYGGK